MTARLILCSLLIARAAPAAERALLLLDDRSGSAAAEAELLPLFSSALGRRGYEVKTAQRARAEELTPQEVRALLAEAKAGVAVAVTIRFALPPRKRGRGPDAGAALGLTATAFSQDGTIWRGTFGGVADPAKGQRPLAGLAISRLLWSFPRAPGAPKATVAELEESEAVAAARARAAAPPDYDVVLDRARASRPGPRFPLRMRKKVE